MAELLETLNQAGTAGSSSAGMDLAVAVSVGAGSLARHEAILPTAPRGLQQLPLNFLLHPGDLALDAVQVDADA